MHLLPLFSIRCLLLGAKCRLECASCCTIMHYGSKTWPVKDDNETRPRRNDARIVGWVSNNKIEDIIFSADFRVCIIWYFNVT